MCHYISILSFRKPRVINLNFPEVEFLIGNKHMVYYDDVTFTLVVKYFLKGVPYNIPRKL